MQKKPKPWKFCFLFIHHMTFRLVQIPAPIKHTYLTQSEVGFVKQYWMKNNHVKTVLKKPPHKHTKKDTRKRWIYTKRSNWTGKNFIDVVFLSKFMAQTLSSAFGVLNFKCNSWLRISGIDVIKRKQLWLVIFVKDLRIGINFWGIFSL